MIRLKFYAITVIKGLLQSEIMVEFVSNCTKIIPISKKKIEVLTLVLKIKDCK